MNLLVETTFHKDKVVVKESEKNTCFYLIKSGTFDLSKKIRKPTTLAGEEQEAQYMVEEYKLLKNKNDGLPS